MTRKSFTIHDLPVSERPRERLHKYGVEALSSQEILALILGSGISGESVTVTSQRLLSRFGNLKGIANATLEELANIKGIGPAKASQIIAAVELANRLDDVPETVKKPVVKEPEDVVSLIHKKLKGKKKEHFLVLSLDARGRLIKTSEISVGSLDSSKPGPFTTAQTPLHVICSFQLSYRPSNQPGFPMVLFWKQGNGCEPNLCSPKLQRHLYP